MKDITKAIEHFKWKFQNSWKPTEADIEAYNSIVQYKKLQEDVNLSKNESLAKLWIRTFILLSQTKMYSSEASINEIDKDLNKSVYDWCMILKEQIPMIRFNNVGSDKFPVNNEFDLIEMKERNAKIVEEFETELTKALLYEPKEEDIIRFVSGQINRIINKFEK